MQTQKLNPATSGTRHQIKILKNILNKNNRIVKNLSNFFQQKQGRGINLGCITVRHKGGGHKKVYRLVNFGNFRGKLLVLSNYYDPFRNAFVSLVFDFVQKDFDFVLMTSQTTAGSVLVYEFKECLIDLKLGYRTLIKNVPAGSLICNLSTNSNSKAAFIRSAGTFGQIIQKTNQFFKIRLPSGKILTVDNLATATIGTVSNAKHRQTVIGKAGRNRLLGKRPGTRGIAMNPVDHPHGGRTNGGQKTCMTPWGKPTRGSPTRKKVFKM